MGMVALSNNQLVSRAKNSRNKKKFSFENMKS